MKNLMKLVIGTDGSLCSDAALVDLKRAGLPDQARILVLSAVDVFLPTPSDQTRMSKEKIPEPFKAAILRSRNAAKKRIHDALLLAKRATNKIKTMFPHWTLLHQSYADSPAWALIKQSEKWKPDLIVVGAHGHSTLGRFLGSVSQTVLMNASCSVRVGRASSIAKSSPIRILIAIDGSPGSTAALQSACDRQWSPNTEFRLISVIDPKKSTFFDRMTPSSIRWFFDQCDDERAIFKRMLESHAKKLRDKRWMATCVVRTGDPTSVLVQEAKDWRADSIFLGARGLTQWKRLFLGGVSSAVVARAHCSVEVVRR